jgi:hypothetical protein
MNAADRIHQVLRRGTIWLDKMDDDTCIFDHVDVFVNLSRENETVQEVTLCIPSFTDPGNDAAETDRYAIWEKVAEGISNLQVLSKIIIHDSLNVDDEDDVFVPDWEILACILRRLRRGIELYMEDDQRVLWNLGTLPLFAGAIHGQAMITGFSTGDVFSFDRLDILCSALLTLPALENVTFEHYDSGGPEEGQTLESMVELLQSPTLKIVSFQSVVFTNALSQTVAKALRERSLINTLRFDGCSFPEGGSAVIASALTTNTTLEHLRFYEGGNEDFYQVLATALLSNSTLQNLEFSFPGRSGSCSWLSPLFLALQVNHGLKKLHIRGFDLVDEELSTAMRLGLGKNSTLESLHLSGIKLGDDDTSLWREALSFLRTNTALKTLFMNFNEDNDDDMKESFAVIIRMGVLAMLCENESLETLSMPSSDTKFEDYIAFVAVIQPNTTLKSLQLNYSHQSYVMDEVEAKDLIPVLKKNYWLEDMPGLHRSAVVRSIFELNKAGRRYLVQDGSSISKGVDVLSRVSDDINSVFLHLLENPRLCDRNAVETSSIGNIDDGMATSPAGNHSCAGKREQEAPSRTGNETRRRLE